MPDHRPEILTDAEWSALSILPEDDLIEVAADLDLVVDKHINHRALWNKCVWAILFRANTEGLPLSEYDAEDVALLSTEQRTAIAKLQGLSTPYTTEKIIKKGRKIYRLYQKKRRGSPVILVIPSLLTAIARAAQHVQEG